MTGVVKHPRQIYELRSGAMPTLTSAMPGQPATPAATPAAADQPAEAELTGRELAREILLRVVEAVKNL